MAVGGFKLFVVLVGSLQQEGRFPFEQEQEFAIFHYFALDNTLAP